MRSALGLPGGLRDDELDRQRLAAAAVMGAAHLRRAEMIEPDGDADVPVGDADLVYGIEADPAEIVHMGFGPGVAQVRTGRIIVATEIAGDVAGRYAAQPRDRDEDVAQLAAGAALA